MSRQSLIPLGSQEFADILISELMSELEMSNLDPRFLDSCVHHVHNNERSIVEVAIGEFNKSGYNDAMFSEIQDFGIRLASIIIREVDTLERERYTRSQYNRDHRSNSYFNTGRRNTNPNGVKSGYGARYDSRPSINFDNVRETSMFRNNGVSAATSRQDKAMMASNASQRNISEMKAMATNQPLPEEVVTETAPMDVNGVQQRKNYAIIGSTNDNIKVTLTKATDKAIPTTSSNNAYANTSKVLLNTNTGETAVKSAYRISKPVRNIKTSWDIVSYDNPTILNPDIFAYTISAPKLTLLRVPGNGKEMISHTKAISEIIGNKNLDIKNKYTDIINQLSEASTPVRDAYFARIVSKWNKLACCNLVSPSNPARSLQVDFISTIFELVDNCTKFSAESEAAKVLGPQVNSEEYATIIKDCAKRALVLAFGFSNGYTVFGKNNINLLSSFDELPIVVGSTKRSRDIGTMTEAEITEYIDEFNKNYVCCCDHEEIVVTNLPVEKFMIHPVVNCVTAKDELTIAVLKDVLDKGSKTNAVFTVGKRNWKYVCHIGTASGDLMLVNFDSNV